MSEARIVQARPLGIFDALARWASPPTSGRQLKLERKPRVAAQRADALNLLKQTHLFSRRCIKAVSPAARRTTSAAWLIRCFAMVLLGKVAGRAPARPYVQPICIRTPSGNRDLHQRHGLAGQARGDADIPPRSWIVIA
jgi:hypothetical protein